MTTIYTSLSLLSQQLKREKERIGDLLLTAEDNLNQLDIGLSVSVDIKPGTALAYNGKELTVINETGESAHWSECPLETQMHALFGFRQLLEKLEDAGKSLLSDIRAVQEMAAEAGVELEIRSRAGDIADAIEKAATTIFDKPVNTADPEPAIEEPKEELVPTSGEAEWRKLKPFRRFAYPSGPVPPLEDSKGQKEYARKLLLWYFTHTKEETGVDSLGKLANSCGLLHSRVYNLKAYFRKHFSYMFNNGREPWMHIESMDMLNKMFEILPEEPNK